MPIEWIQLNVTSFFRLNLAEPSSVLTQKKSVGGILKWSPWKLSLQWTWPCLLVFCGHRPTTSICLDVKKVEPQALCSLSGPFSSVSRTCITHPLCPWLLGLFPIPGLDWFSHSLTLEFGLPPSCSNNSNANCSTIFPAPKGKKKWVGRIVKKTRWTRVPGGGWIGKGKEKL